MRRSMSLQRLLTVAGSGVAVHARLLDAFVGDENTPAISTHSARSLVASFNVFELHSGRDSARGFVSRSRWPWFM